MCLCLLALGTSAHAATFANLEVTSTIRDIVGTTAVVTGSGSADNTTTWSNGDSARFILSGDDGTAAQNPVSYGLDIRPVGTTGGFQPGTDSLMIARTVDSQGLMDTGTISLYVRPTSAWTGDFEFSWFDPTFTTAASPSVMVTSLDLDFNQRMVLDTTQASALLLNTPTTVTTVQTGTDMTFTGVGAASFDDPSAAVIAQYQAKSTFDVGFEHTSVALFMFEFRNPSTILTDPDLTPVPTVPLPGGLPLLFAGAGALWVLRWRTV